MIVSQDVGHVSNVPDFLRHVFPAHSAHQFWRAGNASPGFGWVADRSGSPESGQATSRLPSGIVTSRVPVPSGRTTVCFRDDFVRAIRSDSVRACRRRRQSRRSLHRSLATATVTIFLSCWLIAVLPSRNRDSRGVV